MHAIFFHIFIFFYKNIKNPHKYLAAICFMLLLFTSQANAAKRFSAQTDNPTSENENIITIDNVYEYLFAKYPQYHGITYGPPTLNILRKNDWFIQTPNIWGYDLDDYKAAMCDENGLRYRPSLTKCDPCFNLPQCSQNSDCNAPEGFPIECRIPNFLESDGVQGCPLKSSTVQNQKFCMTPAQKLLEEFYSAITSARYSIDIASYNANDSMLTEQIFDASGNPTGIADPFFFVLKKALHDLAINHTSEKIPIRIVGGTQTVYNSLLPAQVFLKALTADLPVTKNNLEIVVVPFLSCPTLSRSCGNLYQSTSLMFNAAINHAKNIVIDKSKLITGGENFWGFDYMTAQYMTILNKKAPTTPVNDAMIKIEGPVANGATVYENTLFGYLNWLGPSISLLGKNRCYVYSAEKITEENPCSTRWIENKTLTAPTLPLNEGDIRAKAMFTAELNSLNNAKINGVKMGDDADQSEPARAFAISHAIKNVKILQQSLFVPDIPPVGNHTILFPAEPSVSLHGPNPNVTINSIAAVFQKNIQNKDRTPVPVYILTGSFLRGGIYSSFGSMSHLYSFMCKTIMASGISMNEAITELNTNLHMGYLRYNEKKTKKLQPQPANHNKFWMIDDHLFYFGAHNFYPQAVQEFGIIIDNSEATEILNAEFWDKAWMYADKSTSTFNSLQTREYCMNPYPINEKD